jgi:hypothetical protein
MRVNNPDADDKSQPTVCGVKNRQTKDFFSRQKFLPAIHKRCGTSWRVARPRHGWRPEKSRLRRQTEASDFEGHGRILALQKATSNINGQR